MVSARARAFTQSQPSETYRYGGEIRAQTANNRIPRCWRPRRDDRLSGELPRRPAAVRVPSCSRPSRTLRAATRCPSGLLDGRRARRLWRPQVGTKKRFAQAEQRSDPRIKRCADLANSCAAMWTGLSPPLTLVPVDGAPCADSPLQGPPDPNPEFGMASEHLFENGDGPKAGSGLQHRHDLRLEDIGQRVRPPPSAPLLLLRR